MTTPEPHFTPFTVIIDTREQAPWAFQGFTATNSRIVQRQKITTTHPLIIKSKSGTLPSGDYSIESLESQVAIERKSLSDLYGTLLSGRDRFTRELERLSAYQYSAVVVEASFAMVANNNEFEPSKIKSVVGSILAFDQRYPTSWWFLPTRAEAERFAFRALERFWKDRERDQEKDRERKEQIA